jgi:hypothetical protein
MLRRLAALLLLSALTMSLAPEVREHCAPKSEQSSGHHQHHEQPAQQQDSSECDHCPPDECATTAPCGGSLNSLASAEPSAAARAPQPALPALSWRPAHSRNSRPPTPPPTSLL